MTSLKREVWGWVWFIIIMIVLAFPIFGAMRYFGIIGTTVVENIVYKNSFQYKEGMEQRANTLEANLAEIDMLIATGKGDVDELNAQKSFLRVQLNAIRN